MLLRLLPGLKTDLWCCCPGGSEPCAGFIRCRTQTRVLVHQSAVHLLAPGAGLALLQDEGAVQGLLVAPAHSTALKCCNSILRHNRDATVMTLVVSVNAVGQSISAFDDCLPHAGATAANAGNSTHLPTHLSIMARPWSFLVTLEQFLKLLKPQFVLWGHAFGGMVLLLRTPISHLFRDPEARGTTHPL